MASESRRNTTTLKEDLFERASAFEFFQAVRLLHKLHPSRAGVGRDADPDQEAVRFRSDTSFVFPEGDLSEIAGGADGKPDEMVVKLLGIASPGSFGSLPTPYIEELRRQERVQKNPAMREFFDLFNHRIVSLFYRAWERSQLPVLHDLRQGNAFESALRAAIGLFAPRLAAQLPFDATILLSRAGLLAMAPAPAIAIESIITSLFGVPARVEQFLPSWYAIDPPDRSRLGSAHARLGVDLHLGEQVLLVQSRFRASLGPMDRARFRALLPDSEGFAALSSVVRLAAGVEFDFEVQLVLAAADVPETRLAGDRSAAQLGWTSWLRTQDFTDDARAAVFEPAAGVAALAS